MKKKELIEEHKKLVKVLRKGTLIERKKEASKQAKELKSYTKGQK